MRRPLDSFSTLLAYLAAVAVRFLSAFSASMLVLIRVLAEVGLHAVEL
jgi:hypothetical protein